jgi:small subunit ribosomal protein S9
MAKQFKKPVTKIQRVVKKKTPTRVASPQRRSEARPTMSVPSGEYQSAIGRRKNSVARVRLYMQTGDYIVNDRPMVEYFNSVINPEKLFMNPFRITDTLGKYGVSVKVSGSGIASQLDATVMAISRALVKVDPGYKKTLRDAGFMTRDPRMKETRKPGRGGRARAKRQSPKR